MSRRPGAKGSLPAGCLIVFFLPFLVAGIIMFVAAFNSEKTELGLIFGGLLFTLVGGGGMFGALRASRNRSTSNKSHQPAKHWRDCNFIAKHKPLEKGVRGLRLDPGTTPFGKIVIGFIIALFWNGIVGGIFYAILTEESGVEIVPVIFLSCFGIIGLALIGYLIYVILHYFLTGATHVEISKEPVRPGDIVRLYIIQPGTFDIAKATVKLLCTEKASYRQGTDTVTVQHVVLDKVVAEVENVQAREMAPIIDKEVAIPDEAMHSFSFTNNKLIWSIKVEMDIPGRPDVSEEYELRVVPEGRA